MKDKKYDFRPGDSVRVSVRIVEGGKERIQDFEGVCLRRHGGGLNETFTVRRISYGVGMERVFPVHSPRVTGVRVVRRGKVRRAHLTYLRKLRGKKARITEDLLRTQKELQLERAAQEAAARDAAEAEKRAAEAQAAAQAEAERAAAQAEMEAAAEQTEAETPAEEPAEAESAEVPAEEAGEEAEQAPAEAEPEAEKDKQD